MADYELQATYDTSVPERLIAIVQELSQARDVEAVTLIVREAARELTGADGASFVLRDGDQCFYADESAIAPLWKGKRFPMRICVSGWVMLNAQPAIIADVYEDPRVLLEAYRVTFVKSMAMVPIRRNSPVGAIGIYWSSPYLPAPHEINVLQALADATSVALENAELIAKLQLQANVLEKQRARNQNQHDRLEVFTRALAHDLKEPVRSLLWYSEMLREEPEESENYPTYLSYIHNAATRMDNLMNAVFRYTGLDDLSPPARPRCSLKEIADTVCRDLGVLFAGRDVEFRVEDLPELHADPAHLTQLLHNLVSNAVIHNENPVRVTISWSMIEGHPTFSVTDNGIGLYSAQTEQIFKPFRRLTHLTGCSGLGLATCRRIVAMYDGEIHCDSAPGRGAIFTFTLPASEKAEFGPDCPPEI